MSREDGGSPRTGLRAAIVSALGIVLGVALAPLQIAAAAESAGPLTGFPVRAGDPLDTVLAALNARGYHIVYSSALVRPEMTLRALPAAGDLDGWLREALAPWKLRAVRAANGDWLIASDTAASPAAPAAPRAPATTDTGADDLATIDVTATRRQLAVAGSSQAFLDRKAVEQLPHLADDALRMLKVLPGVTGGDFSAALNVRGGRREEARLTIDGAEIHNAFHFRDIDGAFSVLDTHLVESVDFVTGGMTADVGDYMSASVGLQTRRPTAQDEYRSGVGISFVSAYGRTSGTFADERGDWVVSARRGFLDVLTERVVEDDEQLTPRYSDAFAAVGYEFSEHTSIDARFLLSDDDLKFITEDDADDIDSAGKGHSVHAWLTLDHDFTDALRSTTLLSVATVEQSRDAAGSEDRRTGAVFSDDEFRFYDLKQDWSWAVGDSQLPRWGFDVGKQTGDYDYSLFSRITDPLISPVPIETSYATRESVELRKTGVYGAWRSRVTPQVTGEIGARWDRYDYGNGLEFDVVSPRVNAVFALGDAGELRAAWGVMHQPQAVNELQVEDDVTTFFRPERVAQAVVGYTHRFGHGISARFDLYHKTYGDLRPRFENALDPVQLIPEGSTDRVRIDAPEARARGVEITVRREAERGLAGWVSLSLASAQDHVGDDWIARTWDQRETLAFGGSWTGAQWTASLAGLIHDGTPTTSLGIESTQAPDGSWDVQGVVGPRNGERLAPYARLDLRLSREVRLTSSKVSLYLEITNLLNRKNECCVENYRVVQGRDGRPVFDQDRTYWLPLLPSLGVQVEF
ncbi:MAG TPA: TonB-dependent receptor [Steroidobacteraceae bacterium]|nr:TonB-dependent receptor [Steroidobacteraceae bacterium]